MFNHLSNTSIPTVSLQSRLPMSGMHARDCGRVGHLVTNDRAQFWITALQQLNHLMSTTTFVFAVAEMHVSTVSLFEERMLGTDI